ncbi:unnamed protein product [Camellia sinensis]
METNWAAVRLRPSTVLSLRQQDWFGAGSDQRFEREGFEMIPDPDLPGHLLLEQYQAQLVSVVCTALGTSSGPILLEAGLQLATKILTNGIISGDQIAVKRIFSLISHPLNNFEDLYYPSFAEWVSCKYLAQLPLFSESSSVLGKYWISILKDYSCVCFRLHLKQKWKPFLDGIQSPLVSTKLQPCLEEAWPVILQAVALDAVPVHFDMNLSSQTTENNSNNTFISGYSMVQLKPEEFQFLWGFALLVLFQGQDPTLYKHLICLSSAKAKFGGDSPVEDTNPLALKLYEIVLPVFQLLSTERLPRNIWQCHRSRPTTELLTCLAWGLLLRRFTDMTYKVVIKGVTSMVEKEILNGISGSVNPGEVLALMGPSGSGKTTLLSLLGGRVRGSTPGGSITYNDQPYSKFLKSRIGFVTQDDVLFPHLTVRETLTYAALLRLPKTLTKQEKEKRAIDVIDELGLERCQDTMIDYNQPFSLFLDEPTSGLDSTTALRIVQILQDIAEGRNDFEIYDLERTVGHTVFASPKPVAAGDSNYNLLPKGLRSSRND